MVPPKKIQGSSATQRHHAAPGINPKFSNPQLYSTSHLTLHDITSHSHEDPSGSPLPPPPQTIQPSETLFAWIWRDPDWKIHAPGFASSPQPPANRSPPIAVPDDRGLERAR